MLSVGSGVAIQGVFLKNFGFDTFSCTRGEKGMGVTKKEIIKDNEIDVTSKENVDSTQSF